jgi:sensor c-di-GMP phosphodiesterase-like protein
MRDGIVDCSTVLGELRDHQMMKLSFLQRDGTRVYSNHWTSSSSSEEMQAVTLQLGDDYITFSPNLMDPVQDIRYHYSFFVTTPVRGPPEPLFGRPLQLPPEILGTSGEGRTGNVLYATRCSAHYFDCVTAYVSSYEVLGSSHGAALGYGATGAMGGLSLALLGVQVRRRRQALEEQLWRAVRDGRLHVVYQPIVDVKTNRTVGAEALARWVNENGDAIRPDTFIPMAERLDIIGKVTQNVVSQVLNELPNIIDIAPDFKISLNLTAAEVVGTVFTPDLIRLVSTRGLSPHSFAIEITERSTANEKELANGIERLHALGFSVYIDDFGTGYSSLSYLANLQVDMIKIDHSFTRTIGTNSAASIMMPHLLEIAAKLHIGVIVEGVETDEQAAYIAADPNRILAQGWYFGRPMPVNILKERLEREGRIKTGAGECRF